MSCFVQLVSSVCFASAESDSCRFSMLHWRTGQIPLDAKVGIRKDLVELEGLS